MGKKLQKPMHSFEGSVCAEAPVFAEDAIQRRFGGTDKVLKRALVFLPAMIILLLDLGLILLTKSKRVAAFLAVLVLCLSPLSLFATTAYAAEPEYCLSLTNIEYYAPENNSGESKDNTGKSTKTWSYTCRADGDRLEGHYEAASDRNNLIYDDTFDISAVISGVPEEIYANESAVFSININASADFKHEQHHFDTWGMIISLDCQRPEGSSRVVSAREILSFESTGGIRFTDVVGEPITKKWGDHESLYYRDEADSGSHTCEIALNASNLKSCVGYTIELQVSLCPEGDDKLFAKYVYTVQAAEGSAKTESQAAGAWVLEGYVLHGESTKNDSYTFQTSFDTVAENSIFGYDWINSNGTVDFFAHISYPNPPQQIGAGEKLSMQLTLQSKITFGQAWAGIGMSGMEQNQFEEVANRLIDTDVGTYSKSQLPPILLESDNGDTVLSSGWVIDGHNYLPEHTDGIMKKSNVFSTVMPDSSEFGERCSLYIGTHPSYTFKAPTGVMVEYIYIWSPNGAVLPDNAESSSDPMDVDTFDGIVDYNEDGGLPLIVIGGIAVGGLAAVAAIIAAIAKAAAAKAAAAAQAAVVPETVSYQPEVYDWRGNRIDENARVRQTEQEYVQANRETQAQLDAERERIRLAEEAARQKAIDDHNAYVERLSKKYFGTISSSERAKAEMAKRILENRGREETIQKYIGRYQRYSHGLETLTGLVESGSDIFIDVGGDMGGPVGKGIRAGYKVIKPAIKNFCERGSTMRSVLSAAIKGAGDAASDFLPADGKGKELAKQMAKKAGVQFTGELTGELIDEGGSVTRAVYNTAVKTVINTAKDEIGSSNFIKGSTSKWSEGGKRYLMSTSGTLAENSLSMKGAK